MVRSGGGARWSTSCPGQIRTRRGPVLWLLMYNRGVKCLSLSHPSLFVSPSVYFPFYPSVTLPPPPPSLSRTLSLALSCSLSLPLLFHISLSLCGAPELSELILLRVKAGACLVSLVSLATTLRHQTASQQVKSELANDLNDLPARGQLEGT